MLMGYAYASYPDEEPAMRKGVYRKSVKSGNIAISDIEIQSESPILRGYQNSPLFTTPIALQLPYKIPLCPNIGR